MTWNISSGLPPGLSFTVGSVTGIPTISGTPTTAGTYGATVSVNDGLGGTGTAPLSCTVAAAAPPASYPLTISPTSFSMQVGVPFSVTLTATK